eukprot:1645200-Prymnesium_polylepis.1
MVLSWKHERHRGCTDHGCWVLDVRIVGCRCGTEGGMRAEAHKGGNDLLRGHRAEHVKGPPVAKRP